MSEPAGVELLETWYEVRVRFATYVHDAPGAADAALEQAVPIIRERIETTIALATVVDSVTVTDARQVTEGGDGDGDE